MSSLDTLARRSVSELQSEVKTIPVPRLDFRRIRQQQIRRTIRTSVWAVAAVVIVVGVQIWLGAFAPDDPVTPPTTIPDPVTTIPDVHEEGRLTVETSLGTWQWVRDEEPGLGRPEEPARVDLSPPPLPEIEELVWPQMEGNIGGVDWHREPIGGFPVSSGEVTITPAGVAGHIDWNRFYTNDTGWVEGRWRPGEGDCPWPGVCPTETATLEIVAVREEADGGGVSYPVDGVLDVLVASIIPGDPDAVEFRDEETGGLVLRIEANDDVSARQLMRAGQGCVGGMECGPGGMYLWELYVDGVGWVDPPWQELDLFAWPGGPGVQAGVRGDGFWIVGIEGSQVSSTLHAWSSSDGVNWEQLAPPYPLDDLLANGLESMDLVGADLMILTPGSDPDVAPAVPKVLRLTSDGFVEVEVDLSPLGLNLGRHLDGLYSTPWGWIAVVRGCRIWVSADGTMWEGITLPDGSDTGDTVRVLSYTFDDDGTGTAEGPGVPTLAESVPARVAGSGCRLADDAGVYIEFEHHIEGEGTVHEGENYPDFFYTSWLGGFMEQEERGK